MTEEVKKGPLQKLKENITDKEEQLAFISVVVRLVVVAWSGFIVSLNLYQSQDIVTNPRTSRFLPAC